MCAEIKTDGSDGPEELIGKRYTYTNTYNGIPLQGNHISVGIDSQGVYDIIDSWIDLVPVNQAAIQKTNSLTARLADPIIKVALQNGSLAYIENAEGDYVLSIVMEQQDGTQLNLSLLDGKEFAAAK